jgi:hypothetical protein
MLKTKFVAHGRVRLMHAVFYLLVALFALICLFPFAC